MLRMTSKETASLSNWRPGVNRVYLSSRFIGEEVSDLSSVPDDFETLMIPAQAYTKFTNGPGAMPQVVREPWFKIWETSPQELGGTRSYLTDFEIYDERAADHEKIVLDIYTGLKRS